MKAYDLTDLRDVDVAVAGDIEALQSAEGYDYTADETDSLLILAARAKASDLHVTTGVPPVLRIHGKLWKLDELAKNGPGGARGYAVAFLERHPGMAARWPRIRPNRWQKNCSTGGNINVSLL